MIKGFLSRYRPRYLRSLAYLLQASEYKIGDYLAWFHKVKDFSTVEKRKELIRTSKSLTTLILLSILLAIFLIAGIWVFLVISAPYWWIFAVLFLLLLPYLLAYGIIVPLWLVQLVVQKPVEWVVVGRAKKILKNHKAIKIAIAGSFGKTSMREIVGTVLSEGKKVALPPHSYNTPLGISAFVKSLKGDEEVIVFELGEYYPGDVRKLCGLTQPDVGIITGVNEAHLQKFKTLARTARTIFELSDYLGDKPVYVNGESEIGKKYALATHILYDRHGIGTWRIEDPATSLDGTSFVFGDGKIKLKIHSELLGLHQLGPLAVAAHLALQLGLTPTQVEAGSRKTKPFDHRLEKKVDANGVITLDDSYNGNPHGVRAVIEFLGSLKDHRRWYVTPGLVEMGARTQIVHRDIGKELAEAGIEKVVLIKNSVTPHIAEGLRENNYKGEIIWFDDALTAFAALPLLTVRGDVVLLQNDWPDQYR
jgi:UDP-N-acetylmuramoyl-tripeptide--D-alanyl-D-alanine ligase